MIFATVAVIAEQNDVADQEDNNPSISASIERSNIGMNEVGPHINDYVREYMQTMTHRERVRWIFHRLFGWPR